MQGLRVAVGILGILDMLASCGVIVLLCMILSVLPEPDEKVLSGFVAAIPLAALWMIMSASLLSASYSKSRIIAQKLCHPWLCSSKTFVYIQIAVTYFVFLTIGVTYTILFIVYIFYRAVGVILVKIFMARLGCDLFIRTDRASTAESKAPQYTFIV